jgi:hypothetical protein
VGPPQTVWEELGPAVLPNYDELITEDGKPVDNTFVEKQYRLLTEPLYTSWEGPGEGRLWVALANVGWFYVAKNPAIVPDVLLSLDIKPRPPLHSKEGRSYFQWVLGKPPDVGIEIVSDRRGDEEGYKWKTYAQQGLLYYVIFDPEEILEHGVLRAHQLMGRKYEPIDSSQLPEVGLGLKLWPGRYEDVEETWLRWCDARGNLIPTAAERIKQEQERTMKEKERAERFAAQLRKVGIEPEG